MSPEKMSLRKCHLKICHLRICHLRECHLRKYDLRKYHLRKHYLRKCHLRICHLRTCQVDIPSLKKHYKRQYNLNQINAIKMSSISESRAGLVLGAGHLNKCWNARKFNILNVNKHFNGNTNSFLGCDILWHLWHFWHVMLLGVLFIATWVGGFHVNILRPRTCDEFNCCIQLNLQPF